MPEVTRDIGKRIWQNITPSSEAGAVIYKSGEKMDRDGSGKASSEEAFLREREGPRTEYVREGFFLQRDCFSLNLALYYILT